jgi:hypothetical protein
MILKTPNNGYFNLDKFAQFYICPSFDKGKYWIQVHDSYESEDLGFAFIYEANDEAIAQTILDEIMHRWISGDKFCDLSTILDEIYQQEELERDLEQIDVEEI